MEHINKLLIICGPTATGKTACALRLAEKFHGELVSADSRQIYKGFDVLTGKDLPEELIVDSSELRAPYNDRHYLLKAFVVHGIPLWMYDVVDFSEEFSVAQYQACATAVIQDIWKRGKLPIVVGGTGLYIKSLTDELSSVSIPKNMILRTQLDHMSVADLQQKLKDIDGHTFDMMNMSDRQNPRRLVRKIEIVLAKNEMPHGLSQSHLQGHPLQSLSECDKLTIGLKAPIEILEQRIKSRVIKRLEEGAVDEVRRLDSGNQHINLHHAQAVTSLGLDIVQSYINGTITKEEAIDQWVRQDRLYTKRQMTWFKKQSDVHWFDVSGYAFDTMIEQCVNGWYTSKS